MIVCQCVGVSDREIVDLIDSGASSVREITRLCGAGRCCAPCRDEIAALLAVPPAAKPRRMVEGNSALAQP